MYVSIQDRESALHSASSNKKTEITKLLIENGIKCNIQDKVKNDKPYGTVFIKLILIGNTNFSAPDLNFENLIWKGTQLFAPLKRIANHN